MRKCAISMSPQQLDFSNVLRRPIRGDPGISRDQEPQAGQVMMSVVKSVSSLRTGVICSGRRLAGCRNHVLLN